MCSEISKIIILILVSLLLCAAGDASPVFDLADSIIAGIAEDDDPALNNAVMLLEDGFEAFLLRVHLIRNARESIDLQTFILADDECGRFLMAELFEAAQRGAVKVRVMTDHYMSARDPEWTASIVTAHPNLEIKYYRPPAKFVAPPKWLEILKGIIHFRGTQQRMHNKLMVFDGKIGIVGGRNCDNHYYNNSTSYNFLDRDAAVIGPAVAAMSKSFDEFWDYRRAVSGDKLLDVSGKLKSGGYTRFQDRDDSDLESLSSLVDSALRAHSRPGKFFARNFVPVEHLEYIYDAPGKNQGKWIWGGGRATRRLRHEIAETEKELVMQSPYLILNYMARRKFKKLKRKNPDLNIFISTNSYASTDNILAYSANYKLRSFYIESLNFRIHELKPYPHNLLEFLPNHAALAERAAAEGQGREPFISIHGKSFVIDGEKAFVGSFNLDPRSRNLNTENGVMIADKNIAASVRNAIMETTKHDRSWTIAKKRIPLSDINYLIEGISGLSPVDIWPLRNTSSFDLIDGKTPVQPGHDDFYKNYIDVGSFPGAEGLTSKQITTHLYKMLNTIAVPIL